MAKRELNDILEAIKAFEIDDDIKIGLLEDISDSFTVNEVTGYSEEELNTRIEEAKAETEKEWKSKYMARFGGKSESNETPPPTKNPVSDIKPLEELFANFG